MSSALDLVVLNGPREGDVVPLSPSEPLKLGRSIKGYQLVDPLVSLTHAEIAWEGDCYWIQDLGSATGTFVNDVRLSDKPMVIVPGMRLRFGETVMEIRPRPKSGLFRIFLAGAAVLVVGIAIQQYQHNLSVHYEPVLVWTNPVKQGPVTKKTIEVPTDFIRETGVDHRGIKINDVTDYDADGVDEMWLTWTGGRRLVTFNGDGEWVTLSDIGPDCEQKARVLDEALPAECYVDVKRVKTELPEACKRYGQVTGFPDLDCAGSTWRFYDGTYHTVAMDGVVAWMPPMEDREVTVPDGKKKTKTITMKFPIDGTPAPSLLTLTKPAQLEGFLADRGITEPIHYLVCEDALPDIRPQVLTASGRIISLPVGCLGAIEITGPASTGEFNEARPKMMAFTGTGYERLLKDVAVYLGGGEDDSYMDARRKKVYATIAQSPQRRQGSARVVFEGPEQVGSPIAPEGPIEVVDRLLASEFAAPLPARAWTITMANTGRYDLEGCSELEVKFLDWHCSSAKGCGESDQFMQLRNIGCGPKTPKVIPYKKGVFPFTDEYIDGRVIVEAEAGSRQIDILRVRFSYSLQAKGAAKADAGRGAAGAPR
ncbi:MAG TPA: FHA domain-containing protein [Myxococcota bacterium]|nr:FHA domain-containing protein [Myxococcota bacterium]